MRLDGEELGPLVWMLHVGGDFVSSVIPLQSATSHHLTHERTDVVFCAVVYSSSQDSIQAYLAGRSYLDLSYLSTSDNLIQRTDWITQVSSQSLDITPDGELYNIYRFSHGSFVISLMQYEVNNVLVMDNYSIPHIIVQYMVMISV